jgi:hypothetical protein
MHYSVLCRIFSKQIYYAIVSTNKTVPILCEVSANEDTYKEMRYSSAHTIEPGYNDIGLYDTSLIQSDIVVRINSSLLAITLYSSVTTTLVCNDTKYSVPFTTL